MKDVKPQNGSRICIRSGGSPHGMISTCFTSHSERYESHLELLQKISSSFSNNLSIFKDLKKKAFISESTMEGRHKMRGERGEE